MATRITVRKEATNEIIGKRIVTESITECREATIRKYGVENVIGNSNGTLTLKLPRNNFIFTYKKVK